MTGTISCFSYHNVMEGGDDHRSMSIGVHSQKGGRNAPTVWNAAYLSSQFWDGRAATLEEQALGPVINPIEMGMANLDVAIDRIRSIPDCHQRLATYLSDVTTPIKDLPQAIGNQDKFLIIICAKECWSYAAVFHTIRGQ